MEWVAGKGGAVGWDGGGCWVVVVVVVVVVGGRAEAVAIEAGGEVSHGVGDGGAVALVEGGQRPAREGRGSGVVVHCRACRR